MRLSVVGVSYGFFLLAFPSFEWELFGVRTSPDSLPGALMLALLWATMIIYPVLACGAISNMSMLFMAYGIVLASLTNIFFLLFYIWLPFLLLHFVVFSVTLWIYLRKHSGRPVISMIFAPALSIGNLAPLYAAFLLSRINELPPKYFNGPVFFISVLLSLGAILASVILIERLWLGGSRAIDCVSPCKSADTESR